MDIPKTRLERIVQFFETKASAIKTTYVERAHGPLSWIVGVIFGIFSWYRHKVWNRYTRNQEGERTKKRVGITLASTVLVLWMIPKVLLAGWQGFLMVTTPISSEEVYLFQSEEVDAAAEIFSIRGCWELPCEQSDAIYFRVRSTLAHNIYSYLTEGQAFYPDYVAGVVAPGVNKCTLNGYGIRIKALMRGWGVYPDMLNAVCTPYETKETFTTE